MELSQDFKEILTKFGRLPKTDQTLHEYMKFMADHDKLQDTFNEQKRDFKKLEVQIGELKEGHAA